ncbi:hypothetical protein ACLOJK_013395 [Asimina triloba]
MGEKPVDRKPRRTEDDVKRQRDIQSSGFGEANQPLARNEENDAMPGRIPWPIPALGHTDPKG